MEYGGQRAGSRGRGSTRRSRRSESTFFVVVVRGGGVAPESQPAGILSLLLVIWNSYI